MPRVLRLAVFQYLPFFSNALPLAPIGALGIGVLPKSHPTIIYPQIAFGAAIACPRSRLAGHAGCHARSHAAYLISGPSYGELVAGRGRPSYGQRPP